MLGKYGYEAEGKARGSQSTSGVQRKGFFGGRVKRRLTSTFKSFGGDRFEVEDLPKSKWKAVSWTALAATFLLFAGMVVFVVAGVMASNEGKHVSELLSSHWNSENFYESLFWASLLLCIIFFCLSIISVAVLFTQEMKMEWRRLGILRDNSPDGGGVGKKWTSNFMQKFIVVIVIIFVLAVVWYVILACIVYGLVHFYTYFGNAANVPLSTEKQNLSNSTARVILDQLPKIAPLLTEVNSSESEALHVLCPSLLCMDLTVFRGLESDNCVCNQTVLTAVVDSADRARELYIVNLVGVGIMLLSSILLSLRCMLAAATMKVHLRHWEYMQPVLVNTKMLHEISSDESKGKGKKPSAVNYLNGGHGDLKLDEKGMPTISHYASQYMSRDSMKAQLETLDSYFPPVDVEKGLPLSPSVGNFEPNAGEREPSVGDYEPSIREIDLHNDGEGSSSSSAPKCMRHHAQGNGMIADANQGRFEYNINQQHGHGRSRESIHDVPSYLMSHEELRGDGQQEQAVSGKRSISKEISFGHSTHSSENFDENMSQRKFSWLRESFEGNSRYQHSTSPLPEDESLSWSSNHQYQHAANKKLHGRKEEKRLSVLDAYSKKNAGRIEAPKEETGPRIKSIFDGLKVVVHREKARKDSHGAKSTGKSTGGQDNPFLVWDDDSSSSEGNIE